jgi:Flp pilus assembly protein TadB
MRGRGSEVPRNLIIFGLALIAAAILFRLVALVIDIAIPAGLLLVAIGAIWYLVGRRKRPRVSR